MSDEFTKEDVAAALAADSTQLNAIDLAAGPIVVQILHAKPIKVQNAKKATVTTALVTISGPWKPWKMSKTSFRVAVELMGEPVGGAWNGRWIRLYRDPSVIFSGEEVGGIRMSGLSGLKKTVSGSVQGGKNSPRYKFCVEPIQPTGEQKPVTPEVPPAVLAVRSVLQARVGIIQPPLTSDEKKALMAYFGDCNGIAESLTAMDDPTFTAAILSGCGRAPTGA